MMKELLHPCFIKLIHKVCECLVPHDPILIALAGWLWNAHFGCLDLKYALAYNAEK